MRISDWSSDVCSSDLDARLLAAVFVFVTALQAFLLGLVLSRRTAKPLLTVLFVATAFAAHYIGSFKVYLDPDMIRNVLETDPREAGELIGPGLVLPLLGLAVLPVAVLWRLRLRRRPLLRALWIQIGRASCREGVWQYVEFSVVPVSLTKKKNE